MRVLNRLGATAQRVRPGWDDIVVHDVLLDARRQAALDDFGDGAFREGLNKVVAALNNEAGLSTVGKKVVKAQITSLLVSRLRIRDYQKKHEYLDYEEITAPIIVCGLPRTGTTLLSHLLDQDPMNRSVLGWEASNVAPPPTLGERAVDPRLFAAAKSHGGFTKLAPHLRTMHATDPHLPTECVSMFGPNFESLMFETLAWIPSYGDWWQATDMADTYRYHRLQLQILQSTIPTERWSLKSPAHLWHLDALRAVYPDALMVWTHRDPLRVVPSVASLVTSMHAITTEQVDHQAVGRAWMDKCAHAIRVGSEARGRWDASQWFDLQYAEFHQDPVSAVERLYQYFGLELRPVARRRMETWMQDNPQHKHGVHRYSVGDYSIDALEVAELFGDYVTAHRVPSEQ